MEPQDISTEDQADIDALVDEGWEQDEANEAVLEHKDLLESFSDEEKAEFDRLVNDEDVNKYSAADHFRIVRRAKELEGEEKQRFDDLLTSGASIKNALRSIERDRDPQAEDNSGDNSPTDGDPLAGALSGAGVFENDQAKALRYDELVARGFAHDDAVQAVENEAANAAEALAASKDDPTNEDGFTGVEEHRVEALVRKGLTQEEAERHVISEREPGQAPLEQTAAPAAENQIGAPAQ